LKQPKDVLGLGRHLVRELGFEDRRDTLDAWASTSPGAPNDLHDVLAADRWARAHATDHLHARVLTGDHG
jgi:hypothetical protein